MKKRTDFRLICLGLLLAVALLTPGLGQAKEERGGSPGMYKEKLANDLNLTPRKPKNSRRWARNTTKAGKGSSSG